MSDYSVRYIHKIRPSEKDVGPDVYLGSNDFLDRKTLAAALRERRILCSGERLNDYRIVEPGKIVAFPASGIWHSIVLTEKK